VTGSFSIGLDTSGSTVPYIAGWGENGELDAIRNYAETIDKLARRVENAIRETASHSVVRCAVQHHSPTTSRCGSRGRTHHVDVRG